MTPWLIKSIDSVKNDWSQPHLYCTLRKYGLYLLHTTDCIFTIVTYDVSNTCLCQTKLNSLYMWPNEPDQPNLTQPEFGPWGPNLTELNPNLDPVGPTRPKIRFKSGLFGFIKYIIVLNPNLNPIGPFFQPWGSTRILDPKTGSTRRNGSGLAALVSRLLKS